MTHKRIISFAITIAVLLSAMPFWSVSARDDSKMQRTVYIHAQGENPSETVDTSTVYMGENTDIYFAVDNPNKGEYDEDTNTHLEKQYDMNGYTLRILFDPAYFDFAPGTQLSCPIDYRISEFTFGESGSRDEQIGEDTGMDLPAEIGYFPYRYGSEICNYAGRNYKAAYITVFYSGGFVPQKKPSQLWYNLAGLTLTPLKTGSTAVFVDIDSGDEDRMLELFAKNDKSDELSDQTFAYSALYGGYHYITIKDRTRPAPPVATPSSGSYAKSVSVELTQEDNLDIFYTTDGSDPVNNPSAIPYTAPIEITMNTKIRTCSYRSSDGKYSKTVDYAYTIVPERPYLFDESKTLLPDIYREDNGFSVYVSDKSVFGNIDDGSEVYYTFSSLDADNFVVGNDPESHWVLTDKQNPVIQIDRKRTVKLVTMRLGIASDTAWYYFSIKPAPALASAESGTYLDKIEVSLASQTQGALIYYTTDGSDPTNSLSRREYDGTYINLSRDCVLRTVAYSNGEWSDKKSYNYIIHYYDDYGIDAFYPSGVYAGSVNVTLMPNNPEYEIYYHTGDGMWKKYDGALTVTDDTDITAKTVEKDMNGNITSEGRAYSFTYKIKPLAPLFAPESTQFTNAKSITIYTPESTADNTSRYTLCYTLDGSDPITNVSGRLTADLVSDSAVIEISKYTVVSAVVIKDGVSYSSVVTHSYDIVTVKPVKPLTTLVAGEYVLEAGGQSYSTQFMPVPTGTKIYYTVSYDGGFCPEPVPGTDGTYLYDGTQSIAVRGNTVIKAVCVNSFGTSSDTGIFSYRITPEAPYASPSAVIGSDRLPVIRAEAVQGSTVYYELGGITNSFVNQDLEEFFIDTGSANAFGDAECTELLGELSTNSISSPAYLKLWCVLDGIESDVTYRTYTLSDDRALLCAPYADKETGLYDERVIDTEENLLCVKLYSLNSGGYTEYKINDGEWTLYTDGSEILISGDTVLKARYVRDGIYSSVSGYVYNFVPLAPVIELPSGTYLESDGKYTSISLDPDSPKNKDYTIWYRANGDPKDYEYTGRTYSISHTMSFKAYIVNNETGRKSPSAVHYYIIESPSESDGTVYIAYPYNQKRIAAQHLGKGEYAEGIKLLTQNPTADIYYYYTYTKRSDGQRITSTTGIYDVTRPIIPTVLMDDITIVAYLVDGNLPIENSEQIFTIDFVHLEIPQTSLEDSIESEFPKGTDYTIENDHHGEQVHIYYTLDGSNPSDPDNPSRIKYDGEDLSLDHDTYITTVYYSYCGTCSDCDAGRNESCWHGIYGEVGAYYYTVPRTGGNVTHVSGGGGGGKVIDNTREYTVDIFGTEHPTHIGYINGYPDGSVRPEGNITRDEMVAVIYRIRNHDYEEPFAVTGTQFPDVNTDCWAVKEIEYMAHKGVVTGYPDGEFRPRQNLTRGEFAAIIARFTGVSAKDYTNPYVDLESSYWAYKEILALKSAGIMVGYNNKFNADDTITRAEVMTAVNRLLGRKPSEDYVKALKVRPYIDLRADEWYFTDVMEATITHDYYLNDSGYEYKWENIK